MSAAVMAAPGAGLLNGWYRERPFSVALVVSLVAHGLLVLFAPPLRHIPPAERPVLQVEMIEPDKEPPPPPPPPRKEPPPRPRLEAQPPPRPVAQPVPPPVPQAAPPRELAPLVSREVPQVQPVPEFKPQPRPEPLPTVRTEVRPDLRPVPRPEAAVAPRIESRTALTAPAPAPDLKPLVRPDAPVEVVRPEPRPEVRPDARPVVQVAPTLTAKPELRPEPAAPVVRADTPVVRNEPRPEPRPEIQATRPAPVAQVAPVVAPAAVAPAPPMDAPTLRADAPAATPSVQAVPARPGPERAAVSGAPASSGFDRAMLERYALDFSRAIGRNQNYPRRAIQVGWQGKAELEVRVGAGGEILDVHVAKSTGYPILDEEAVAMVKRTRQLPAVPEGIRGRDFTVLVPVMFKLE